MSVGKHTVVRELVLVGAIASAIALILYEPNAIHGGFLSDAWANLALYEFAPASGFADKLSYFMDQANIAPRPLQAVYLLLLFEIFGDHVGFWLTWQVATNVAMVLALFLLLRRLSIDVFDAGAISLLALIFPAASSMRLWTPTIWAPLSIMLVLIGFTLALAAFDARRQRVALALHGVSLLLFVASLLLYEVTLLIMLASVLLYRLQVPWRRAARRWVVDCAVLIPLVLTVTLASSTGHQETEAGLWAHATAIFEQSRILFTTVVLPFGSASWYVVGLFALVPAAALLVYLRLPKSNPTRQTLGKWLIVSLAGLLVVMLGYAIYVPGTDYYNPTGPGVANRVNAVPSIGWVLILYAGAALAGALAFRDLPKARLFSAAAAGLACALISVGWIKSVNEYADHFINAYAEDTRVLAMIERVIPQPKPNSTIWTFGQPVEIAPGVPVFGNTWDMTGSVQLRFDDPTLASYVASVGTIFDCRQDRVLPGGTYAVDGRPDPTFMSPYGRTYFIDTVSGRAAEIDTRKQCRDAAMTFPFAPLLPES